MRILLPPSEGKTPADPNCCLLYTSDAADDVYQV